MSQTVTLALIGLTILALVGQWLAAVKLVPLAIHGEGEDDDEDGHTS